VSQTRLIFVMVSAVDLRLKSHGKQAATEVAVVYARPSTLVLVVCHATLVAGRVLQILAHSCVARGVMARFMLSADIRAAPMRDMRCGRVASVAGVYAHRVLLGAALVMLGATAWAYARGATSYIDNGDGYYLYAARRVAQGATLYRDVMGTQPPVVYLLGAAAFKLGAPLQGIRLLSAAMRVLATALVYLLSRRLFDSKPAAALAALAALLYALLPIGLVWDRSFDVNPPLTLVALLAALALSYDTRRTARASGLLAALALFTKDLYVPLLAVTLLYLILRRRRLLAPYLQGLMGGLVLLGGALVIYAGSIGPRDAFLGQDGSPFNPAWFVAAVAYVAASEGGIVLVALAGAAIGQYARRRILTPAASARSDYAPWLLVGSAAVLLATLKEGTAGPVFQLAEPAVALLAAHGALWAWRRRATRPAALALPAVVLLSVVSIVGADRAALAWGNSGEVARVVVLTRERAHPGAVIVAPPYYALLTGTHLPGDAADTYIVARRVARGDRAETAWVRQVVAGIDARRYPVVLVDLRLAAIAPLIAALQRTYRPLYADTLPSALHVTVYVPVPDKILTVPGSS